MGIHPKLDLQRSSACSVTPPGLPSPVSAVSLSNVSGDKLFGRTAPISPPMSSHELGRTTSDMSPGKSLSTGRSQREVQHEPTRQQLPSLSSLFAANQHVRPVPSPLSDRTSPLFGTQSPSDRPPSASTNPERPYSSSSSYFPNISPTLNQPRPVYEPRLLADRPLLPSVARTFPGPLSPPIREYDQTQHTPRSDGSAGGKWAHAGNYPDPRRPEYVYGPRSDPQGALPSLGPGFGYESSQAAKMDGRGQAMRPSRSPTSPGSASPETILVKDGLGPKIWTGTHFLPRFVRRAEVPGEGPCYFYDDGTHCKTVIDGEAVNAHWGVTKAGKPRKRLAIACLTCREKKIKCDPDYPRCVQCEKFGRVCKFKNAPRGGHNTSPATSPGGQESSDTRHLAGPPPPQRVVELDQHHQQPPRSSIISSSSVSPSSQQQHASNSNKRRASPELPSLPPTAKRSRFTYDHSYSHHSHPHSHPHSPHSHHPPPPPPTSFPYPVMAAPTADPKPTTTSPSAPWQPQQQPQHRELPGIRENILYRKWQPDPYVRDVQRTR
ncbi:hypothetical protein F4777DRAFT_125608 [Nemania sp. FL0916]|nr:hypothetical protein F4777DRAFT_125608 [Nemania sp. FL0916]